MRPGLKSLTALLALLGALCGPATHAEELGESGCGTLKNPVGPLDYYSKDTETVRLLSNVEAHHFDNDVRTLQGGETGAGPMGDLDYTLRAFPNHPEALTSVARYALEGGKKGQFRSAECYFDRALRFKANDATVHMLYGIYLARTDQNARAVEQYEAALTILPDYTEAHYNIGLVLVKMGRLDEARAHAEKAYSAGYPLDGLRKQLIRLNAWK